MKFPSFWYQISLYFSGIICEWSSWVGFFVNQLFIFWLGVPPLLSCRPWHVPSLPIWEIRPCLLMTARAAAKWALFCLFRHPNHSEPRPHRNLLFICLQKSNNTVMSQCSVVLVAVIMVSTIRLGNITALIVFLFWQTFVKISWDWGWPFSLGCAAANPQPVVGII